MILADVVFAAFVALYLLEMASFVALYFLDTASCVGDKGLVDASCGQFLHNTGVLGDPYPGNDLSSMRTLHEKSAASAFASASTSALAPYTYLAAYALGIPLPFGYISNILAFAALASALGASALEVPLPFDDILNIQAFVALACGDMLDTQAFVASALAYGDTLDTQAYAALASALAGYIAVVR